MSIHIDRAYLSDRQIDVDAWNLAVKVGFRVGYCDCGESATGQVIPPGRGIRWATLRCPSCGEAAYPVRELAAV